MSGVTSTNALDTPIAAADEKKSGPRSIPFGRPMIGEEERAAVHDVLCGPLLTHGPRVKAFEAAFAAFAGAPYAVATSSCTAALHMAYMFLEIKPGDEVIVPAQTHVASAHAVELCGARAVFVDAEARTSNIDIDLIEDAITPRTRAISVVHFLGMPVDMPRVLDIARRHGLPVVEDCALAIGATVDEVHVGLLGDVGCFSFYPVKHITTGEGGMLITDRSDLAAAASTTRAFGIDRNIVSERPTPGEYDVTALGNNYRMNEIAAAIGLEQMKRLPSFLATRRENHMLLADRLRDVEGIELLESGAGPLGSSHYCLSIVLEEPLASRRAELMKRLRDRGVGVSVYYPRPVPHMSYYRSRDPIADNSFPVASRFSAASVALPVGPHLREEDVSYISDSVWDAITAMT